MGEPRLILASASPRRRDLLAARGVAFDVRAADVDETPLRGETAEALAVRLAEAKARKVAGDEVDGVVLGADTTVAVGDELLGKPEDADDARRILRTLSGTRHRVVTGFCAIDVASGAARSGYRVTYVDMRPMTAADIDAYVASGECFGKAGAYAIQETGDRFVTRVDGATDNVAGLPTDAALAAAAALVFAKREVGTR